MHQEGRQNIRDFRVVGVNYKKTDASIRGLFAISNEQYDRLLAAAEVIGLKDIFVVSTCNRTEIYGFAESTEVLSSLVCEAGGGDPVIFKELCYEKSGYSAIEHLYSVAAGLDSQILGDYEILGQIKKAVKHAKEKGFIGSFLERLINSVLQSSKAVKTNTELSSGTVSVSFAAVQYIKEYVSDIADKKIVLIGAGKIGTIACRNLVDYLGTRNITILNRTDETAVELAKEIKISAAPYCDMDEQVAGADVLVISTSAPEPLICKRHLEGKGNKVVIDLSVPCNVHKEAQQLSNVLFADVDLLSKIKDETLQKRKAEVPRALEIIAAHIAEFIEWYEMRKNVPVLKEVKSKLKTIHSSVLMPMGCADEEYDMRPDDKIQKVINSLASKMRHSNTMGCNYIEAINNFIA